MGLRFARRERYRAGGWRPGGHSTAQIAAASKGKQALDAVNELLSQLRPTETPAVDNAVLDMDMELAESSEGIVQKTAGKTATDLHT